MRALDRGLAAACLVIAISTGRAGAAELRQVDVERLQQGSTYPWQAVVSADGAHVYVLAASLERSEVFAFRREPDGAVTPIAGATLDAIGSLGRSSLVVSADGRHLYAGIGAEQIAVLARDASTGSLTQLDVLRDVSRQLTASPDGKNLYALFPALLVTYTRDQATGLLARTDLDNGITGPVAFDNALDLAVSPDGMHLYLATAGTTPGAVGSAAPSLIVFARDPSTGAPEPVDAIHDGENGVTGIALARSVRVSPDGHHVYASGGSDDVASFARDVATGKLTFLGVASGGGFTGEDADLAVSPDGERVVVTGAALGGAVTRDGLTIFARDPRTGLLTWLETRIGAPGDGPDLVGPTSVEFAPDGHDLYVSAGSGAALTAFRVLPHCSAAPADGCATGRSQIVLGSAATDTLLWKWRSGAASGGGDFGDPRTTTDYAFCLHREIAGDWTSLLRLDLPAASTCGATNTPCWRSAGKTAGVGGHVFRDATAQHAGVTELRLTPRRDGRASILLRGRGARLGLPALPLGPAERVVAQLRTGDGACWSATYAAPARRDDGGHFSDRD